MMNVQREQYLGLNETFLKKLRFWTDSGPNITFPIILYVFTYSACFVGGFYGLNNTLHNLPVFSELLNIILIFILVFHKSCSLFFYKERLRRLIYVVRSNFFMSEQMKNPLHHLILEKCEKQGRVLFVVYAILCGTTATGFLLYPLVRLTLRQGTQSNSTEEVEWNLPFFFFYPIDFNGTNMYIAMYILNILAGLMTVAVDVGHDTFIVLMLLHACSQFKILNDNLQNLQQFAIDHIQGRNHQNSENSGFGRSKRMLKLEVLNELEYEGIGLPEEIFKNKEQDSESVSFQGALYMEMRRRIKVCVEHHQLLIKFVQDLEGIMNVILLDQFISSSLKFCMTAFSVIVLPLGKAFHFVSLMMAVILQLFMYCFIGDLLREQGEAVAVSAYSSEWYDYPKDIKKSLLLIMMGSRRPVILTIGKFAALTLGTFAATLRASYTYFTLLNEVHGK